MNLNERIGAIAIEVWNSLDQSGPVTVAGLAEKLGSKAGLEISMAVGWLAREDKIKLKRICNAIEVSLK